MSRDEIFQKLVKIVSQKLQVHESEIKEDSSFVDDFGADSLDLVELIMKIEEEFGIEISDEQSQKILTVKDAIDFIESKLSKV
ncbi:MAG: acyl carrier protein [Candidatus Calescibacterium sp.]|nr:acyl carrier protein [Candidatus Calescibacterium sp.]MCX7972425.1 acyl carrier protein [bacterium]MDW8195684.1 acyl carrier protein [Candidatus Calescibacterium sp.]